MRQKEKRKMSTKREVSVTLESFETESWTAGIVKSESTLAARIEETMEQGAPNGATRGGGPYETGYWIVNARSEGKELTAPRAMRAMNTLIATACEADARNPVDWSSNDSEVEITHATFTRARTIRREVEIAINEGSAWAGPGPQATAIENALKTRAAHANEFLQGWAVHDQQWSTPTLTAVLPEHGIATALSAQTRQLSWGKRLGSIASRTERHATDVNIRQGSERLIGRASWNNQVVYYCIEDLDEICAIGPWGVDDEAADKETSARRTWETMAHEAARLGILTHREAQATQTMEQLARRITERSPLYTRFTRKESADGISEWGVWPDHETAVAQAQSCEIGQCRAGEPRPEGEPVWITTGDDASVRLHRTVLCWTLEEADNPAQELPRASSKLEITEIDDDAQIPKISKLRQRRAGSPPPWGIPSWRENDEQGATRVARALDASRAIW